MFRTDLSVARMDLLDRRIAARVALAMSEAEVGLGQIAARIGLDAAVLAAAMAGSVPFTATDLVLIACALRCDPADLLPGAGVLTHADREVA
ncbi:hypothetical protein NS07_v2contig00069-0031 [Nocardia seriolae]|nr:hypothetical protein NS07_v2contig00069-0031 [Nocardia seriolae]